MESFRQFFGTQYLHMEFSSTASGTTHTFEDTDDFLTEIGNARVWGGMHYRTSTEVGADLGTRIAKYVAQRHFKPGAQRAPD